MHRLLRGFQQLEADIHRLGEQRQARHGRGRLLENAVLQGFRQVVGIALDDRRLRETPLEEAAELAVVFDQNQPVLSDAAPHESVGHGSRSGAKLDHGAGHTRIDIGGHRARQHAPRGRDGTCHERAFEPRPQKARLVLERILTVQLSKGGPLGRLKHENTRVGGARVV
jgi:hypothetical protein